MCCVVGYVGKTLSRASVLDGLSRLEYRGYDSCGFACLADKQGQLLSVKAIGDLQQLSKKIASNPIDGAIGIGHTRWSTHGAVTEANAHPQGDCTSSVMVVHNGIVENYHELKAQLQGAGHRFSSQTDTEVIAHLFEDVLAASDPIEKAVQAVVARLDGAFACLVLSRLYPDVMIAVRRRSPLCIGFGESQMFVASDPLAFAGKTNRVIFLPDESFALVVAGGVKIFNFSGSEIALQPQVLDLSWAGAGRQGYEHFMLKEMYEQKKVIADTVAFSRVLGDQLWDQMGMSAQDAALLKKIDFVACGSSLIASAIGQFFFEKIALIPAAVHCASEFRYRRFFAQEHGAVMAVSQSGETADTLEAIRLLKTVSVKTIALTNVASSTLVRETDGFLLTQARQEISVASTKSFSAQIAWLYLCAHRLAHLKGLVDDRAYALAEADLLVAAEILENVIEKYKQEIVLQLAPRYAAYKNFIFLGRQISYPIAQEAALKLKEIAYVFVDCYPAGELKHGPLALVEPSVPVFIFSVIDQLVYQKLVANAQEVKARNGHLVVFAFEGQDELIRLADYAFIFPVVNPLLGPLAQLGLAQFFAYSVAKQLGNSIDKPRNLAKSVTVE